MKKITLLFLSLFASCGLYFSCQPSKPTEQATVVTDTAAGNWGENDNMVLEPDTAEMIRFQCYDLPKNMEDEFNQTVYLNYGKYLSFEGAGFEVLKSYAIGQLLDTSRIDGYFDGANIKQRYFVYIYNRLPKFIKRSERHNGYYADMQGGEDESKLLAYAIYRIDRSPENIKKVYYGFLKNNLRSYVSAEQYEKLGIKNLLHSLLDTYKFIHSLDNAGARMDSTYMAVDSINQNYDYDKADAYGHSLDSDYNIYKKYLSLDKFYEANQESYEAQWAFSFWVRRRHEKNEDIVIEIVRDLVEVFER